MLAALIVVIAGLFAIRTFTTVQNNTTSANNKLSDVKDKLASNNENVARLTDNLSSNSLAKSRAFADMLALDPSIADDPGKIGEIMTRLDVSELHIIDAKGIITSSSVPEYVGFDMGSGEQSAAFLKIIDNPSLEIAQEPQENAAAHKLMQYIGVVRKDAPGLVQVGVHPDVLESTLASTAIDVVLRDIDYGTNGYVYAIDPSSGSLLAHKNASLVGTSASQAGFTGDFTGSGKIKVDGVSGYFVAEKYDGMIIGTFLPSSEYFSERNSSMTMISITMVIIFGALLVMINRLVDVKIINGINNIGSAVKKIAAGDLSSSINERSNPELEQLSEDINKMSLSINSSLSNNEELLSKQRKNMVNIRQVCEDLEKVSEAIHRNSELILEGTGEQETAVDNLKEILNQLAGELNENVSATLSITEDMDESVQKISITGRQIDNLKGSMQEIAEMSKSIESIIDEINSIADQTKILSINATIEAARAGAAGKGFAVVASEVGSLAQKSTEAAKKTNDLITSTIAAVRSGQNVTEDTAKIFGETVKGIEKTNSDVKSIAEMVKKNVNIVNHASDGMHRISDVVEKNVRISQDTKQVSDNMTKVSGRLMHLVE